MGRAQGSEETVALERRAEGRAVIAVDFDGTAWAYLHALRLLDGISDEAREKLHPDACDDWMHPANLVGLERMEEARTLELIEQVGLLPGFAEAMRTLERKGFQPVILTHNSEWAIGNIKQYLASQGFDYEVLRARPQEKIDWCKQHGSPILIDDAPETIELAHAQGVTPISLRYLYNAEAIDKTGCTHARDWYGLLPLIETALAV